MAPSIKERFPHGIVPVGERARRVIVATRRHSPACALQAITNKLSRLANRISQLVGRCTHYLTNRLTTSATITFATEVMLNAVIRSQYAVIKHMYQTRIRGSLGKACAVGHCIFVLCQ